MGRALKWGRRLGAALLLVGGMTACIPTGNTGYRGYTSPVYSQLDNWICHPAKADFCDSGHDATRVDADGTLTVEPWHAAEHPKVDCFYLYPTTSRDPGRYSDGTWTMPEEGGSTWAQVGRFGSLCRVFVPVYRSYTLTAAATDILTKDRTDPATYDVRPYLGPPYADILDAWKHYIANDNHGRGVILLGHSQGSLLLQRLIKEEIDPQPALRRRLVGAYLIGASVQVRAGSDVGGDYQHVPLCRRARQVGCVVTWATFRDTVPPEPFTPLGRDQGDGLVAGCTNPAALAGGKAWLHPYLSAGLAGAQDPLTAMPSGPWVDPAYGTVTTPWVTLPQMVEGECVTRPGFHYLAVTTHGDPADPRVDDLGGDLTLPGVSSGTIGLHNFDYGYALGDLVQVAAAQIDAYCARLRP